MKKLIRNILYRKKNTILRKKKRLIPVLCLALISITGAQASGEELSLERALNIAFQNSPALRQASLQLEVSKRNLMAQQAGLKSHFSLSVTPFLTSSSRVFSDLTSSYNTQTQTRTSSRFTIRQPIKWTDGTLMITNNFN